MLGLTLAKCLKLFRADVLSATDTGVSAVDLDPLYAVPLMATMAVAVPSCRAVLRWFKGHDSDGSQPGTSPGPASDTVPDSVRSIFEVLDDVRNGQATGVLDAELANLLDEPDWDIVNRRLDDAVKRWCKERPSGAGNPPDEEEIVRVLLSLIHNVREATYWELFAEHYHRIVSVDRRDRSRVNGVFVNLRSELRVEESSEPEDEHRTGLGRPEDLDFRGRTPTDTEAMLRQCRNLVILNQSQGGMCIFGVLRVGVGVAQQAVGP